MFAIAEFAIGVEVFEFGGDGFGSGFAMLLEVQAFLAQAGLSLLFQVGQSDLLPSHPSESMGGSSMVVLPGTAEATQ